MSELDLELRDLLVEIAGDPRSSLFRATPHQIRRVASDATPALSPADSTFAERKILQHYPVRVARLFRHASEELALATPAGRRLTSDCRPDRSLSRHEGVERLSAPAVRLEHLHEKSHLDVEPATFLQQIARNQGVPSADVLATAALRLDPRDEHRIRIGYNKLIAKQSLAGVEQLRWIIDHRGRRVDRIQALQGIALGTLDLHGPAESARILDQVTLLDPSNPLSAIGLLMCAAMTENAPAVREHARRIDDILGGQDELVESLHETHARQRQAIHVRLTPEGLRLLSETRNSSTGAASRILSSLVP